MSIVGYSAENYRSFEKQTDIELRPLTLLFGYNSAGKSALLRLLPLIRDSILLTQADPIALLSKAARGASFGDVRSRFSSSPTISFELRWSSADITSVRFVVRDLPEHRRQIVEKLTVLGSNATLLLSAEWVPQESDGEVPILYRVSNGAGRDAQMNIRFRGLTPQYQATESNVFAADVFVLLEEVLDGFADEVIWLEALRALPPRREVFTGVPLRIGPEGHGITQLLAYDDLVGGAVREEVSQWYQSATRHKLEIRRGSFGGKELFSAVLSPMWPAPGSADTELGVLMEPEVCHGETEVYTGVQA